ncbi:hypothetical protein [Flammeovirga sp. SJP92]|uniref:hypothetical protein n=1 Tax=Flammeovirga sp. SJP92 TaxID=1775430 RepID=UPI00078917B6|nr:hypothetical protein [Flammeovirga sp. SJP92]KXX69282.1 hypothetical protein AVL50_19890 [Flammeovirga sp. SJP92]
MSTKTQTGLDLIAQLKAYENVDREVSGFDYDLDDRLEDELTNKVYEYANQYPDQIKKFCRTNKLKGYDSANYLVYIGLTSEEGSTWYPFLFEELKRIVKLVNNHDVDLDGLVALNGIFTFDIYYDDHDLYNEMMSFAISNLDLKKGEEYNLAFIKLVDSLASPHDETEFKDFSRSQKWIDQLVFFANNGPLKVKLYARKIIEKNGYKIEFKPFSLMEKIKKKFIKIY